MAAQSSILAWRIPWTEEPGGLHTVHGVAKSQTWLKWLSTAHISLSILIGKNKNIGYTRKFKIWQWQRKYTEIKLDEFNMLSVWGFEISMINYSLDHVKDLISESFSLQLLRWRDFWHHHTSLLGEESTLFLFSSANIISSNSYYSTSIKSLITWNLPVISFFTPAPLSPGEGHGNPLQYSCLENPMDSGAW